MFEIKTWVVTDDGKHNAFTDLLFWRDSFWLVYISSPSHFRSKQSQLCAFAFKRRKEMGGSQKFNGNGEDIRDPKLAIIHGQMFLYALLNKQFDPEPYKTIVAHSDDGANWTPLNQQLPIVG